MQSHSLQAQQHNHIITISFFIISGFIIFTCMCPLNSDNLLQEKKRHNKEVSLTSSAIPSISTKLNKTQAKQQHSNSFSDQVQSPQLSTALDLSKLRNLHLRGNPNTVLYRRNTFRRPGCWPLPNRIK